MNRPFKVNIADEDIIKLKEKLKLARWPDEIENSSWQFGADLSFMRQLADYWQNDFDWRKTEAFINSYPNFISNIDGHNIHYIHIKSNAKKSVPIIITHGWPGSFLEMMKLVPLLTKDPDFSFDIVIPSILGFGFSDKITKPGCNLWFIADLWHKLMQELGYIKFIAQGGDFGAAISTALGAKYPGSLIGLHLNYIPGSYFPYLEEGEKLTDEETSFQKIADDWYKTEGAYAHQHRTRPLTLAYSLNDSPIGLCAWIIEKFYQWSDCNDDIETVFTKDELLANVSLYWFTQTAHSSIRLYNENSKVPLLFRKNDFIHTPVAIARFRKEEPFPPRKFIERGYNIQRWTDFDPGGHFAAMEQPELLANDIIEFASMVSDEGIAS